MEYQIATESIKDKLLEYINSDIYSALYIYLNLERYGTNHDRIGFWYSAKQNKINSVVMKYNQSMQILSVDNDFLSANLINLFQQHKPNIITGNSKNISLIKDFLPNYTFESGYVSVKEEEIEVNLDKEGLVEIAQLSDMREISELICTDSSFKKYSDAVQLENELSERFNSSYSRNYIIRMKSKIIAHYSTYAENQNIAVVSGLIVDEKYKGQGYGLAIAQKLYHDLLNEGKVICDVRYSNNSFTSLLSKGGFKIVRNYAKLIAHNND